MKQNMDETFALLNSRVVDCFNKSDLEKIRYELSKLNKPTIASGVGGSKVVSEAASKILNLKNNILTTNFEPRDFLYSNIKGYKNVLICSYGGKNYGVDIALNNNLNHYLFSCNNKDKSNVINIKYDYSIEVEKSFISLSATLIPISILLTYYDRYMEKEIPKLIQESKYEFVCDIDAYEIFSGKDTSITATYLESTMVESGIGIPIVHDKYGYCHGRSTLSKKYKNIAIYLNRNTELDKLLLEELSKYYQQIIVLDSKYNDQILADYEMLIKAMYLTKSLAEKKNTDLSIVDYSPIVKKLYYYNKEM